MSLNMRESQRVVVCQLTIGQLDTSAELAAFVLDAANWTVAIEEQCRVPSVQVQVGHARQASNLPILAC